MREKTPGPPADSTCPTRWRQSIHSARQIQWFAGQWILSRVSSVFSTCQAPNSSNAELEQAGGFACAVQQNLLRILVGLAPQDATEIEPALAMWRGAQPVHRVGRFLHIEALVAHGQPEHQGRFALVPV